MIKEYLISGLLQYGFEVDELNENLEDFTVEVKAQSLIDLEQYSMKGRLNQLDQIVQSFGRITAQITLKKIAAREESE